MLCFLHVPIYDIIYLNLIMLPYKSGNNYQC